MISPAGCAIFIEAARRAISPPRREGRMDRDTLLRAYKALGDKTPMLADCGALCGAQMALGLIEFKGHPIPAKARAVMMSFREKAGATQCRVLKGVDTGVVLCPCDDCVRYAIDALEEALS